MKILIVAATRFEVQPLLNQMEMCNNSETKFINCIYKKLEVDFLIAGIGMVATAYYTGKKLPNGYDLAVNTGICGSFDNHLEIGDVVNIMQDHFADLGAEDGNDYLTINEIGLEGDVEMINEIQFKNEVLDEIPQVCGITVNTAHGNEQSIKKIFEKFHPNTESMEGAAFMFACAHEGIPYAQIRAVSNYMGRRNKDSWNIPLAIENLNKKVLELLNSLE